MIHAPHIIKLRRTRSKFLRRRLNASKGSLTAHLGAALSGGTLDSADFFWLGYFDYPISSGIMESINNFGTPTRMAYGYRDVDYLHLRTTPSMSQKAYSLAPRPRLGSAHLRHHARLHGHPPAPPAAVTTLKYRAIYRVDDAQVGQWSAVVSIAVGG